MNATPQQKIDKTFLPTLYHTLAILAECDRFDKSAWWRRVCQLKFIKLCQTVYVKCQCLSAKFEFTTVKIQEII